MLADLSDQLAPYLEELKINQDILVKLDFIFAKASLSRHFNCSAPVFNRQRRIRIKDGRHPLLDPQKVVPINIHLGQDFDLLIVTGPNTGGKTVSLKTVGLFTLLPSTARNWLYLKMYSQISAMNRALNRASVHFLPT